LRPEDLYKAIGEIGEDLLERSEESAGDFDGVKTAAERSGEKPGAGETKHDSSETKQKMPQKKPVKVYWIRYAAAAAAFFLVIAGGAAVIRNWRMGSSAPQEVAEEKAIDSQEAAAEYDEAMEAEEAAPEEEMPMEAAEEEAAPAAEEAAKEEAAPEDNAVPAEMGEEEAASSSVMEDTWDDEPWQKSEEEGAVLVSASMERKDAGAERAVMPGEALDAVYSFEAESAAAILGESGTDDNKLYSPLNLYTAMAMLAGITSGDAQEELIRALDRGTADLPLITETARAMIKTATRDNRSGTSRVSNSLWLRKGISYKITPLLQISDWYNASVFSGKMGSPEYNALLREWISDSTEGLLDEYAGNASLDDLTSLALVSSLYYKAPWMDMFFSGNTRAGTFHSPSGDVEAEMMNTLEYLKYYKGDHYEAVAVPLADGNEVVLYLPENGSAPEQLAAEQTWMKPLTDQGLWSEENLIALEVPSFDVSRQMDLRDAMAKMGVSSVFENRDSFDRVLEGSNALSKAEQAARVIANEEGVTAASYTLEAAAGEGDLSDQIIELTFDRPFMFAIADGEGVVWFAGVVNQP